MSETPLLDRTLPGGAPAYFKSLAAYGEARGVTRAAASAWNKRDGHVVFEECPVTGKRVIDAAASDARRGDNQNPLKAQAAASGGEPAGGAALDLPDPDDGTTERRSLLPVVDPVRESAAKAKAIQEDFKAKQAQLKYRRDLGELVERAAIEKAWRVLAGRMVEAMMMVPVKAAPQANPGDPRKARMAIESAVRDGLERFAEEGLSELLAERADAEPELVDG